MKILVSACLMGENCKYSGGNNYSEALVNYVIEQEIITVCPEVLGGLPTPRKPCEIVNGTVTNCDGVSCDAEFRSGAAKALEIALGEKIDLAILQSRSPSCGVRQVYDGTFSRKLREGQGVFAELLLERGIKVVDIEDIKNGMAP